MTGAVSKTHKLQQFLSTLLGGLLRGACYVGRYHDVLQGGELRQQLVELEDETYVAVAEVGQLFVGEGGNVDGIDVHAAAVGTVQCAHDLQKGGLARSAGAHDADDLATIYVEVDAFEYL